MGTVRALDDDEREREREREREKGGLKMLFLDHHSLLIHSILTERTKPDAQPASLSQVVSDFDGVSYHLSTPENKTKILISVSIKSYPDLQKYGVKQVLERHYGGLLQASPEPGYNFSLLLDLEHLPAGDEEALAALIDNIALVKRNAMAAPFERAFALHAELASTNKPGEEVQQATYEDVMAIQYREEEAMYINAQHDRVTVIFSTVFREETDHVLGEVFLREFVDARKRPAIQNAPQVLFSRQPPLELAGFPKLSRSQGVAYVTFVLFPRHFTPQNKEACISHIQSFRNNL